MVGTRELSGEECPGDVPISDGDCIDAIPCLDDVVGSRFVYSIAKMSVQYISESRFQGSQKIIHVMSSTAYGLNSFHLSIDASITALTASWD